MLNLRASEVLLLGTLIVWSGFMFVGSFEFSDSVARFPQYTSAFVLFGSIVLLVRNLLPQRIQQSLSDPDPDEKKDEDNPLATDGEVLLERPVKITEGTLSRVYLTFVIGGYFVLSYLVGMLWATPVFVALYTRWAKLPMYVTVLLSLICFALAYVLMSYMYLPIDTGILHKMGVL